MGHVSLKPLLRNCRGDRVALELNAEQMAEIYKQKGFLTDRQDIYS